MIQTPPVCDMCGANHPSSSCPLNASSSGSTKQVAYAQNFQRQGYNPYSQTYNPDWRNHLNFSYGNKQTVLNPKPQEKKEGWEEAISKLENHQLQYQERNDAPLKNLKHQMGQIAKILSERSQGALPTNTETNPRENVQVITTRSVLQLPKIMIVSPKAQANKAPIEENEVVQELKVLDEESKTDE